MKTIVFLALVACALAVDVVVPNKVQVPAVTDSMVNQQNVVVPGVGVGVGVVPGGVNQHQHSHKVWPAEVNNVVKEHVDHNVTNIKVQRVPQNVGHVVGANVVDQHVAQGVQTVGGKVPIVDKVPHVISPNLMVTKVQQVVDGVPQVNTDNKVPKIPSLVQEIVQHAHSHIPQVIQHHKETNKVTREMNTMPGAGVGKVQTHIPQVIQEQVVTHVVGKGPNVNQKIPHVVNGVVVQDVINDKVHTLQNHVKDVMKQVEQHIPQVVQNAREQQKQKQQGVGAPQVMKDVVAGDNVAQVGDKVVPQVPSHVQEVVNQVHQHIPQVIQHHHSVHTTPKPVTN